ncbi:MAG: hypothetical protein GY851_25685, partial [bacterium]|nr:hypothetical protein [bacterium]
MIRYARITVAVLLAALSLDSQALETGPLPLEALLDTYKVPVVLEEFEEAYPRLWRYARKPQADLEGRVPLQAVRATSSPRPSGVIRLDLMAHVLREAPHGPERDRLITQFLEDLDEQVRRNDENLPAWCLMETMANSVCYVHPVEPGLYADTVVRRFQAYVEGDDESLRCPAACFLLNVAFRWTAKQAEIVQCVEGQIPAPDASKTPADSVDDPDIFTWDGVCRQLRYLKGDIWSGFATGEQVPESEYAQ